MVCGVVTLGYFTAHDTAWTAMTDTRRLDGVLVVITACLFGQYALEVAEHHTVP
jgi:hypothetical protein